MPGTPSEAASLAESVRSTIVRDPFSKSEMEKSHGTTPRLSTGLYIHALIHMNIHLEHFCNENIT